MTGLLLFAAGTVGLLGALYLAFPPVALLLIGLVTATAGGSILRDEPATPRSRAAGHVTLTLGLTLTTVGAYWITPWAVLFGSLLAVAMWLSGGEE
ncbi:hypothetical protein SAM9427_36770 (plasmid) [Streptomyces sp. ETH9427]|uniref:hypothetical protein n=1 Tax=Streptomyces sp. E1N211 TaxID=1851876 RepID=UPI000E0C4EDF|nr:hypothetical protein [Streptomyces sp. E1N211]AXI91325.1 hypothetical protein SAM9427_36770 [Streptomyces sp. ETH9427]